MRKSITFPLTLKVIKEAIPKKNELYINKNGKIQRHKKGTSSRRSQKRLIVKETWTEPWNPKA